MKKTLYILPITEICMLDSGLDVLATSAFEGGVADSISDEDDGTVWEVVK